MTRPRVLGCGRAALLAEVPDLSTMMALTTSLEAHPLPYQQELVPAARTVLVRFDRELSDVERADATESLSHREIEAVVSSIGDEVAIEVRYDGDDLAEVASLTGLDVDEVIAAHTGRPWTVAFCGFAPGFGYLVGGDPRLHVSRRSDPRTSVPAGSVGLAGEFSGIYPRASPGGWQLIGRTRAILWDPQREPPTLLQPGTRVRFVAVDA